WSLFVATQYTSAPPSPSPTSIYNPMPARSVDFPFFRPTNKTNSRHRRCPVSLWTNPNTDWSMAFCHSSSCRSEEHTSELQSRENLVCRLLLEKKNKIHPT